jgi:hypothetical protein
MLSLNCVMVVMIKSLTPHVLSTLLFYLFVIKYCVQSAHFNTCSEYLYGREDIETNLLNRILLSTDCP